MWGKSVLSPDWSRRRGNDSSVASRLTSHWWRLQSEKRKIISTSVSGLRFGQGKTRNSAAKWIIFFLKIFYESRPSNIRFDVWETLAELCCFHDSGRLWPLQCSRLPDPRGDLASKYLTRNQKIESGGDFTAQIKQSAGNIPSRDAFFSDSFISGSIKTINCLATVDNGRWDVGEWLMFIMIAATELRSYDPDDEMRSILWHESGDRSVTRDTWVMWSRVTTEADQCHEM